MQQNSKAVALVKEIVATQTGFILLAASMAEYANRQPEYLIELSLAISDDATGVLAERLGDIVPKLAEYINEPKRYNVARQIVSGSFTAETLTHKFTDQTTGLIQFAANRAEETGMCLKFLEAMRDQFLPEQERMQAKIGQELCLDLASFFELPKAGNKICESI